MSRSVIIFLLSALAFAVTHLVATAGSLYWYYWWFDIVMHFWGGLLLGLGVHALCRLKSVPVRPTLSVVVVTITVAAISWELFEWLTGLYNPVQYALDTTQDILLGFGGGLLAHFILSHLYNRRI
jgi:predicted membrane-bound dolichyl-phosphate-mannose-protein mannosyltransferase